MKNCNRCNTEKPLTEFYKRSDKVDGHATICKQCRIAEAKQYYANNRLAVAARTKAYREANKDKIRAQRKKAASQDRITQRTYLLRKKHGLTEERYSQLLTFQDNVCAICKSDNPADSRGRQWAVDHDHFTGQVRGLLCHSCNLGLGKFKDDLAILRSTVAYLESFPFTSLGAA